MCSTVSQSFPIMSSNAQISKVHGIVSNILLPQKASSLNVHSGDKFSFISTSVATRITEGILTLVSLFSLTCHLVRCASLRVSDHKAGLCAFILCTFIEVSF
jgi:hypothetical protein